jgi:hypothetical protein
VKIARSHSSAPRAGQWTVQITLLHLITFLSQLRPFSGKF